MNLKYRPNQLLYITLEKINAKQKIISDLNGRTRSF